MERSDRSTLFFSYRNLFDALFYGKTTLFKVYNNYSFFLVSNFCGLLRYRLMLIENVPKPYSFHSLGCVPTSKVSVPHFARIAVFVDIFLWDYNGKPLLKDRHRRKRINNSYNFDINDCRACNLWQRKFGRVLEPLHHLTL